MPNEARAYVARPSRRARTLEKKKNTDSNLTVRPADAFKFLLLLAAFHLGRKKQKYNKLRGGRKTRFIH